MAALLYDATTGDILEWNRPALELFELKGNSISRLSPGWVPPAGSRPQQVSRTFASNTGSMVHLTVQQSFFVHESRTLCLEVVAPPPAAPNDREIERAVTEASIVSRTDLAGTITFVNENFVQISGYTQAELVGSNHRLINSGFHPKSFWTGMWKTISTGNQWRGQVRNKRKDGSFYWVDTFIMPLRGSDGKVQEYISIRNDITSEKEQEGRIISLNRSLIDFQNAIHRSSIVSRTDRFGTIVFVNENFVKISGYQESELVGQNHRIINSGFHPRHFWTNMWRTISSGNVWRAEVKNRAKDGSYYWVDTFIMPFLGEDGKVKEYLSIRNDITERKTVEVALEHALVSMGQSFDYRFEKFAAHLPGFLFQYRLRADGTSHFPFATRGIKGIYGVTPEEVREDASPVLDMLHPEDKPGVTKSVMHSAETLTDWRDEFRVIGPGDRVVWAEGFSTPQRLDDGSIVWSGYLTDITARKNGEELLKESRDRYLHIIEHLPGFVFRVVAATNTINFINGEVEQTTGYPKTEFFQRNISAWRNKIVPDDMIHVNDAIRKALHTRDRYECEYRIKTSDGSEKWIWERGKGLYNEQGELEKIEGFANDITQKKLSEEKIRLALIEKEMLVKEIHHRVKNNLQVISSIIYLKSHSLDNSSVKTFLEETRQKIRAVSLIHERLLETDNVSQIDIADYLTKLIRDVERLNLKDSLEIRVVHEIEPALVNVDHAVYCGLIINELITNAFKHAFHNVTPGIITIRFKRVATNFELVIGDNGTGLPENTAPGTTTSFGMQLLHIFLRQLHADCRIDRESGTTYTISFPEHYVNNS